MIRRDIARTYPEHDFFKEKDGLGQESLFNVMKAYSLHDREVGYCQGSGFIVGLLLMQASISLVFKLFVYSSILVVRHIWYSDKCPPVRIAVRERERESVQRAMAGREAIVYFMLQHESINTVVTYTSAFTSDINLNNVVLNYCRHEILSFKCPVIMTDYQ